LETIKKHSIFIVDDNLIGFGKEAEERAIELFKPKNISINDLAEVYNDLITSLNNIDSSFRKFFKSFLNSHSIKVSMFTIAESIITGRIFKRVIRDAI
jgi:hypothetical protein